MYLFLIDCETSTSAAREVTCINYHYEKVKRFGHVRFSEFRDTIESRAIEMDTHGQGCVRWERHFRG